MGCQGPRRRFSNHLRLVRCPCLLSHESRLSFSPWSRRPAWLAGGCSRHRKRYYSVSYRDEKKILKPARPLLKVISRFHCVYWPAFLMALDLPLPRQILTHAHWTMNHEKMSKSIGNVVNPMFALERFGVDTMRFYLASSGGLKYDADYDNRHIIEQYKKVLHWGLGNLTSRLVRSKRWNVRDSISWYAQGRLLDQSAADEEQFSLIDSVAGRAAEQMLHLNTRKALYEIQSVVALVRTISDGILDLDCLDPC